MANSKIIYYGQVLMDLTADTIKADKLLKGYTAHGADGEVITGTCEYDANTQDATAADSEILSGKKAVVKGSMITGAMPNNGAVGLKITSKTQKATITRGYHDGSGTAEIDSTEQAKLIPSNIRSGVTILGVAGEMSGSEGVVAQTIEVTSSNERQEILPDTSKGYTHIASVVILPVPYNTSVNSAGGITVTIGA